MQAHFCLETLVVFHVKHSYSRFNASFAIFAAGGQHCMKHIILPITLLIAGLSFAQLLPKKAAQPANSIKLDSAMVFRVDYGDIPPEPDSTLQDSDDSDPSINRPKKDNHFIRNFLIGTGACITEATIGAATNSNSSIVCPLTDGLTKF